MKALWLRMAMCVPMYLFEHHLACDLVTHEYSIYAEYSKYAQYFPHPSLFSPGKTVPKIRYSLSTFIFSGKRSRTVPIILTPTMVKCFRLIYKCRILCGVRSDNIHFFALPGSPVNTRGWDALKYLVNGCRERLQMPQSLTGTQLRKQVP